MTDWSDPEHEELARAAALTRDGAPARARLVDVLNEPLSVLPRLAFAALLDRDARLAADANTQRLALCSHDERDLVADAESLLTGRRRCAACDATVVRARDIVALAADVPACALFRGPTVPYRTSWLLVDERRAEPRPHGTVVVGGGPSDDVQNAGLPAGALTISRDDDVLAVECAPGLRASWRPRRVGRLAVPERAGMAGDVFALMRPALTAPLACDIVVIRDHDAAQRAVVVGVDGADGLAVEVVWVGFQARAVARVGDMLPVSFDGSVRLHRTGHDVVLEVRGAAGTTFTRLPPGELVPFSLGDASAVWRGRQVELRGCPPATVQSPRVNLLVDAARRPR